MWRKLQYELVNDKAVKEELKDILITRWLIDPDDDHLHINSMKFSKYLAPFLSVLWFIFFILIWL